MVGVDTSGWHTETEDHRDASASVAGRPSDLISNGPPMFARSSVVTILQVPY